jgi:hypothetical protein
MLILNSMRMVLGDYRSTSNFRLGDNPTGAPSMSGLACTVLPSFEANASSSGPPQPTTLPVEIQYPIAPGTIREFRPIRRPVWGGVHRLRVEGVSVLRAMSISEISDQPNSPREIASREHGLGEARDHLPRAPRDSSLRRAPVACTSTTMQL